MQFNDGLGNGESHARALDKRALILAAIEFFKDHLLLYLVNSGSMVRDAGNKFPIAMFGGDLNNCAWRRVFAGVIEKVDEYLGDASNIYSDQRQVLRNTRLQGKGLKLLS